MTRQRSFIERKAAAFFCGMPFCYPPWGAPTAALKSIRRYSNRSALGDVGAPWRRTALAASIAVWPVWSAYKSGRAARRYGAAIQAVAGKSPARQMFEMWKLAWTLWESPSDYYYFGYWDRDRRASASWALAGRRVLRMFSALNAGKAEAVNRIRDKALFDKACAARGVPTPPCLARFESGAVIETAKGDAWRRDLFFKPRFGSQARGLERWDFDPDGGLYSRRGGRLALSELKDRFARKSRREDYFVQPRVRNHPDIDGLSNGAACALRVLTVRRASGEVDAFSPILCVPTGEALAGNLSDGGISCPLDMTTGRLVAGILPGLAKQAAPAHPVNGEAIAGRRLPFGLDAIALAKRAHRAFREPPVIGWDVACAPEGPLLLEGNHAISLDFHSLPPNPPLGRTAFAEALAEACEAGPGHEGETR